MGELDSYYFFHFGFMLAFFGVIIIVLCTI